ncbi:hypothetical protein [Paraburkholderia bannensis]|uniref:hypothetical protein n=1 Tax=Paraburkholderia bannensis TaxID=765414 RepID=UPI002ABDC180|nr:hypothetical protein [Paraburkholderia bannensis]
MLSRVFSWAIKLREIARKFAQARAVAVIALLQWRNWHTARSHTLGRKKSAEKLKVVAVRVDPAIERRLRLLADTSGRKPSYFLQQLIEGGLGALEEAWLPADVLAQVRAGTVPEPSGSQSVPDLFGDME